MTVQRATVLLLVLFAIVYASVAGIGGVRHGSERPAPPPTPAPTPISVGIDAWNLTPPFAKAAGLPATIHLFAGQTVPVIISNPGGDYKLAHFTLASGLQLSVDPITDDPDQKSPSSVSPGHGVTVVVSKPLTQVQLRCGSSTDCLVSTQ